jgi:hypothetical protein
MVLLRYYYGIIKGYKGIIRVMLRYLPSLSSPSLAWLMVEMVKPVESPLTSRDCCLPSLEDFADITAVCTNTQEPLLLPSGKVMESW